MFGRHGYRFVRAAIRLIVRPRLAGAPSPEVPADTVYVFPQRSVSDLVVLDLLCAEHNWPNPRSRLRLGDQEEDGRAIFLTRPAGPLQRNTMRAVPPNLARLVANPSAPRSDLALLPVQVFWGRSTNRERSIVGKMFSEHWATTSRLRRLVNILVSRNHIVVDFGEPLTLREAAQGEESRRARRAARLLRVRLRQQKVAVLGPDFSHRRTLLDRVVESAAVRTAIEEQVRDADTQADPEQVRRRLRAKAHRAATTMASDMSYPTIMVILRLLTAFWRRIYEGIEVRGIERIASLGRSHTLVYVPCHRSHVDYLLLSYLLFQRGLMIPHIAAGENMNLPVVGNMLRRGGAFFMHRSFRGDPVHAAVFSEYLYQVYSRGHCVEFFPEGGRSRTGRLLPARIGLLKMSVAHARRGLPRPLAFVPVYFGYEKLIEATAYLNELRGAHKQRESILDILRGLRLIRQNFGRVEVNFGEPLRLAEWLEGYGAEQSATAAAAPVPEEDAVPASEEDAAREATALGREILRRINDAASVNPVNLTALVMLCTPRLAISEASLASQIDCYLDYLRRDSGNHDYRLTDMDGAAAIAQVASLGMLNREAQEYGAVLALQPSAAVLMTWYRNNVVHVLALPSLIACLLEARRRPLERQALARMVATVFPYLARELHGRFDEGATARAIEHLVGVGLVRAEADRLRPPPAQSAEHYRLHLLAGIAKPMLERNYIVLQLLAEPRQRARNRAEVLKQSQLVARKVARMHGINAPEFFDGRLFDAFVDKLIEDRALIEEADGQLVPARIVHEVLRAAEPVIDAEFRYAMLRDRGSAVAAGSLSRRPATRPGRP